MTARHVDHAINRLARRQHGAFAGWQAARVGATAKMRRTRVRNGSWCEIDAEVYVLPSSPGTWLRQAMAATLAVTGAGLSGPAAAALHGWPGFRQGRLEITARPGTDHTSHLATVRESKLVEFTAVQGIKVVSEADTVFQLAGSLDPDRLERLLDCDQRRLDDVRDRMGVLARSRLPGLGRMREVLARLGDGSVASESQLERALTSVLSEVPGLPRWEQQARFDWWLAGAGRFDVCIPDWKLLLEADGRLWHTRVEQFEADRWRDNLAQVHGFDVLRFTYNTLVRRPNHARDLLGAWADERGLWIDREAA